MLTEVGVKTGDRLSRRVSSVTAHYAVGLDYRLKNFYSHYRKSLTTCLNKRFRITNWIVVRGTSTFFLSKVNVDFGVKLYVKISSPPFTLFIWIHVIIKLHPYSIRLLNTFSPNLMHFFGVEGSVRLLLTKTPPVRSIAPQVRGISFERLPRPWLFVVRENHQITPAAQDGAADIFRLLQTKNPVCFFTCSSAGVCGVDSSYL